MSAGLFVLKDQAALVTFGAGESSAGVNVGVVADGAGYIVVNDSSGSPVWTAP
jgi:hypothetical protein